MIGRHERDGLAAENALAIADAAIEQHLRKAQIVRRGRNAATATRLPLRELARRVMHDERIARQRILRQGAGIALTRVVRKLETRIGHAERLPEALREEFAEALARNSFDDEAEDIGRETVLPGRARLVKQRRLAELDEEFLLVEHRARAVHGIGAIGSARAAVLIREAGRVSQQILHGHLTLGRHRLERIARRRLRDLHAGKLRQEFRHGIAEEKAPLLGQDHDTDGNHRLGHGGNGEDGIGPHGRAGCLVAKAIAFEQRNLAAPRDADNRAGDHARRYLAIDRLANAAKPPDIESELRGRCPLEDGTGVRCERHGFLSV